MRANAVMRDIVSSLNLQHVFPRMKKGDVEMHAAALKLLLEEAAEQPTAPVYRKNDILPYVQWSLWCCVNSVVKLH